MCVAWMGAGGVLARTTKQQREYRNPDINKNLLKE